MNTANSKQAVFESALKTLELNLANVSDLASDEAVNSSILASIAALRSVIEECKKVEAVDHFKPVPGVLIDGSMNVPALVKIGSEDEHIQNFGGQRLYTLHSAPTQASAPSKILEEADNTDAGIPATSWKLVPTEPSPEMLDAFNEAIHVWLDEVGTDADVYRAIIEAAPKP